MQKWEYLYIWRSRGWGPLEKDQLYNWSGSKWEVKVYHSDAEPEHWDGDFAPLLDKLGDQGWELVGITPRASVLGLPGKVAGSLTNGSGVMQGWSTDYAGYTTDEIWAFKRPKA
jgi:hypothetical protein